MNRDRHRRCPWRISHPRRARLALHQSVPWVCGPFRCWWRPFYYRAWGYYRPYGFYGYGSGYGYRPSSPRYLNLRRDIA
jgi:hypothetical protein